MENISKTFTIEDLQMGSMLNQVFQGLPIHEQPLTKDIDKVHKYNQLKVFQNYLQFNSSPYKNGHYSLSQFKQDLEPYQKYYDEYIERNKFLDMIEQRLHQSNMNEMTHEEIIGEQNSVKNLVDDEWNENLQIFSNSFFTREQWLKTLKPNADTSDEAYKEEYLKQFIRCVKRLHNSDRDNPKQDSLSQNIIITDKQPMIIRENFKDPVNSSEKLYAMAIIPVLREQYQVSYAKENSYKPVYHKIGQNLLKEKRCFGILTNKKIGQVPPVSLAKNEQGSDTVFHYETFFFQEINSNFNCTLKDITKEISLLKDLQFNKKTDDKSNEESKDNEVDAHAITSYPNLLQIQKFNEGLLSDLYKQEAKQDFEHAFKNYMIIPLVMNEEAQLSHDDLSYRLDVEFIEFYCQDSKDKFRKEKTFKESFANPNLDIEQTLFISKVAPNYVYECSNLIDDTNNYSLEDILNQLKIKYKDNYNGITTQNFFYGYNSKLQVVKKFREEAFALLGEYDVNYVKDSPLVFLKDFYHSDQFKWTFTLSNIPMNPTQLNQQKQHNQSSGQNKKIPLLHHSLAVALHYMDKPTWFRALQIPQLFNYIEKVIYLKDFRSIIFPNFQIQNYEYLLWASTAPGLHIARRNYETLETYGDTILKFAATMLAYFYKRNDRKAGEGDIEHSKVCFITNFHLFRVGNNSLLQRWMKTKKDPEAKDWLWPLVNDKTQENIEGRCVGKNVTDAVEASICALYLSNRCLRSVFDWISQIKLVPINLTGLIDKFEYGLEYNFGLYTPLNNYKLSTLDYSSDLFEKYFSVEANVDERFQNLIRKKMKMTPEQVGELGEAYEYCRNFKGEYLVSRVKEILLELQVNILNYKFKNPQLLLEAITHKSAKDSLEIGVCYEKLEVLGDAILDYLVNYSLINYTLFERYLDKDENIFQLDEDFTPSDAHQAKSLLVKNEVLAKLCVLIGIHKYIIYQDTLGLVNKREVTDYLKHSFRPNFKLNQRNYEPFECPKLLGDVFESVVGAIFIDSNLSEVIRVFKHLIGPFVLFIAKFGKILHKEPKEEFLLKAHSMKIKPKFQFSEDTMICQIDEKYEAGLYRADVIYNHGQIMCTSYGSNKRQAERNASVEGLNWLENHFGFNILK